MSNGAPAVRIAQLRRRFGDIEAIRGLSFEVKPGELFGLVGPDGAGKTTLLRMLAGVLRPDSGDAQLYGVSVVRDPEAVKSEIAYMPQRFGLYGDLTVMENLDFYADLYGVPRRERRQRLDRLFQFSNLGAFRDRLAGALSGGMRQKLALSCALIHLPRILLLDEPTFGVDPVSRRDLWLIVHEMVGEGVTAIVSTAYMDEAERFDRLVLLHQGHLLALDSPSALQQAYQGELLLVEAQPVRGAREALARQARVRSATLFGDKLHVAVESTARDQPLVEQALRDAGIRVRAVHATSVSMEDVFIERIEQPGASTAP